MFNFDFGLIKTSLRDVAATINDLRAKSNALHPQILAVRNAPASRSDVKAALSKWVDDTASGLNKELQSQVLAIIDSPSLMAQRPDRRTGEMRKLPMDRVISLLGSTGEFEAAEPIERRVNKLFCALFPEQVKQLLNNCVDVNQWEEGLPLAERPAAVAKIEQQITKLNEQEAQLRSQAAEAGIKL